MSFIHELKRRNVFRVAAAYIAISWLLIQIVETLFPIFELSNAAARVVVLILAIGFLPVLAFSWAFEWTPEGIQRESQVSHDGHADRLRVKRLDRAIMVIMALAIAYFAFDKFVLDPARDQAREAQIAAQAGSEALLESYGDKSIAVLAFEDLSPARDQAYFAEGIAEELLNLLARIPELRVAARTSAFSFRGKNATIPEIGKALSVAHVLEGSVRTAGNRVRITAQLIDARSDTHLWSQTFDRELDDVLAIQDEIAQEIVAQLQLGVLGVHPRKGSDNAQAYALYLQARTVMNDLSVEGALAQARVLLEQALALDPDYVDAMTQYARVVWFDGPGPQLNEDARQRVRQLIDRALAISPRHASALSWRSFLALVVDQDMDTAARYMERAHEADPSNYEVLWGAVYNAPLYGRPDLAVSLGEYLLERDPLCYVCYINVAHVYWQEDDFSAAEAVLRRGLALKQDSLTLQLALADTLVLAGRPVEAIEIYEAVLKEDDPGFMGYLAALHDLGSEAYLQKLPAYLEFHAEPYPQLNAQLYAWTGDTDAAFEWLEKTNVEVSWNIRSKLLNPFFHKLRGDPRWEALRERYGMTEANWARVNLQLRLPPGLSLPED